MSFLPKLSNNTSKRDLIKKLLLFLIAISAFVVALMFLWNYFMVKKVVTLNPAPNTTITIAKQQSDDLEIKNPITTAGSIEKVRLQPGSYVVKFVGSKEYQEEKQIFIIDNALVIKTPQLKYTKDKLAQLLKQEKPALQQVIIKNISPAYSIDNESLFMTGEWYGARLIPKDWYDPSVPSDLLPRPANYNNTKDMLRIIVKKERENWVVAAGPSVIFNIEEQKNIPEYVIRATNKLGFN